MRRIRLHDCEIDINSGARAFLSFNWIRWDERPTGISTRILLQRLRSFFFSVVLRRFRRFGSYVIILLHFKVLFR